MWCLRRYFNGSLEAKGNFVTGSEEIIHLISLIIHLTTPYVALVHIFLCLSRNPDLLVSCASRLGCVVEGDNVLGVVWLRRMNEPVIALVCEVSL